MPYQPALLRILHGLTTVLVMFALATGFWVYNTVTQLGSPVTLVRGGKALGRL